MCLRKLKKIFFNKNIMADKNLKDNLEKDVSDSNAKSLLGMVSIERLRKSITSLRGISLKKNKSEVYSNSKNNKSC